MPITLSYDLKDAPPNQRNYIRSMFERFGWKRLLGQYEISEIISHELMKGEIREDFLISTLKSCSEPEPMLIKGTISDGENDAGQLDIVLCRPHSHIRRLGAQSLIEKNDSLCVIEVKGNCTGMDLKKAQAKAIKIRELEGEQSPLYGVVCYKAALQEKTIMKRFGFLFDQQTSTYFDSATSRNVPEESWEKLEYPDLDFFISLEEGKKIFLRRYEPLPNTHRYIRLTSMPLIKDLFAMVRSLLRTAVNG